MKALELLKRERLHHLAVHNDKSIIEQYDEAIEELKAITTSTTQQTIQSKFKVGDWVVYTGGGYCDGEILQITKIDEKGFCTFGSYNKLYHFNKLRRWKPKLGEWCWVCDNKTQIPYLRKFVCINNIATNTPASYSYKVEYESDIVSYNYIEPFIGVLPSTIEQY